MTLPNTWITDIATKGEQALDTFAELWKTHQRKMDQQIDLLKQVLVGQVSAFASAKAPIGWLVADGARVQRNDYPALWAFAQTSGNLAASDSLCCVPAQFGL